VPAEGPGLAQAQLFAHAGAGAVLARVQAGHGHPLLGGHILGQHQQLAEQLDRAGLADALGAEQQLPTLAERIKAAGRERLAKK